MNLTRKMIQLIRLTTRLSIHSNTKSEQWFAVTSAKMLAVFQASLKLEETGIYLSNRHNNI